ncbi:MFS transporter [Dysgonomonas sp. 216]|uniref:peptide MFS transporter n=1 Tax=Dysgonomonas sp. 216 TaxID=2302934 RepID=UPI0013D8CB9A|nr:peptide MFS transporter [Dysgonomonas sp. 216]NDW17835.1 MFS transporter [Dysgonomonas sp. 216]
MSLSNQSPTLEEIQSFEGKYPKQLWLLFTVEMWERFCFYGMRGILTIFMIDQLLIAEDEAKLTYAAIQSFVYAFTFLGGIFADKVLGFKKSLLFGALLMILGNGLVALSPQDLFFIGISLVVIGTGFFKPNISSMVGDLYKEGDARKEAGFSMFYAGINVGAFMGGTLCVYLGKTYSWQLAFLAASIVMLLGLITFVFTKKYLGPIGDSPLKNLLPNKRRLKELAVYIIAVLTIPFIYVMIQNTNYTDYFMYIIGPASLAFFFYKWFQEKDIIARKKLIAALLFILFSIVFFALFEQAGGALAVFALNNLHDKLLFFHIDPNIVNNSSNAFFVIAFSPLLGLFWLWLNKRKKEPSTVVKFGLGFILLALSYMIMYSLIYFANQNGMTSLNVFTGGYLVMTLAELCISPIGLSMITNLSPKNMAGTMMGLWFLGSAYGQYIAGLLGANVVTAAEGASNLDKLISYCQGYQQLAIGAIIVAVLMFILIPVFRKLMQGSK